MTGRSADLVFRADASPLIGTGHVFRCRAIAEAARNQGLRSVFVAAELPGALEELLVNEGHAVLRIASGSGGSDHESTWDERRQEQDATLTIQALMDVRPSIVVVDHFSLAAPWHSAVGETAGILVCLDELGERYDACDVLVDPSPSGDEPKRRRHLRDTIELRGPRFAPLHPQFGAIRSAGIRHRTEVGRILMSFGGAASASLVDDMLDIVLDVVAERVAIDVVGGFSDALKGSETRTARPSNVTFLDFAPSLAARMDEADLMIGAGGSTLWERCALGLPSLTVATAENQVATSAQLDRLGATIVVGETFSNQDTRASALAVLARDLASLLDSPARRGEISRRAAAITDGGGANRILQVAMTTDRVRPPSWRPE